jgi:hypothetical protein
MATKKIKTVEEVEAGKVMEIYTLKETDPTRIGEDAPLTDMVYGITPKPEIKDIDRLPEPNGRIQGESDPLQLFINLYQPSELVSRINFKKHLLRILNDWKENE